jgi:antitoxin (DNA-binding transcriptional repressor) of toxin-antitoxin stability system
MSHVSNIHQAKTQFSKLVAAVERGERVIICRNGEPVIECAPILKPRRSFPFGAWSGSGQADLTGLASPTDDETLDAMGL